MSMKQHTHQEVIDDGYKKNHNTNKRLKTRVREITRINYEIDGNNISPLLIFYEFNQTFSELLQLISSYFN